MQVCSCGSDLDYQQCCAPYLEGGQYPGDPVSLMRARYSAHVHVNVDFLRNSYHPAHRDEIDWVATQRWAERSQWLGLRVGEPEHVDDDTVELELVAEYRDAQGKRQRHHEISVFLCEDGQWYFSDAKLPQIAQQRRDQPKQGRNDPCACASGRKYKQCCGKRT